MFSYRDAQQNNPLSWFVCRVISRLSPPQVIFSKYTDLLPKEVLNDDTPELQKPDEEALKEVRGAHETLSYEQVTVRSRSARGCTPEYSKSRYYLPWESRCDVIH